MSDVFGSVGTVLSVSAALPATENAAGFAALTYTAVGEVSEIPEFGTSQSVQTFVPIATGLTQKRGGAVDSGDVTLTIGLTGTDAGEAILRAKVDAAVTADKRVSVKIALPNGDVAYVVGFVSSFMVNIGNADTVATASVMLALTSAVVYVEAP